MMDKKLKEKIRLPKRKKSLQRIDSEVLSPKFFRLQVAPLPFSLDKYYIERHHQYDSFLVSEARHQPYNKPLMCFFLVQV